MVRCSGNAVISPQEFGVYFKIISIDESSTKASFVAIDSNHDGIISRDEFVAAGVDFFTGVDEASGGLSLATLSCFHCLRCLSVCLSVCLSFFLSFFLFLSSYHVYQYYCPCLNTLCSSLYTL